MAQYDTERVLCIAPTPHRTCQRTCVHRAAPGGLEAQQNRQGNSKSEVLRTLHEGGGVFLVSHASHQRSHPTTHEHSIALLRTHQLARTCLLRATSLLGS